jgi:hypothetical protein
MVRLPPHKPRLSPTEHLQMAGQTSSATGGKIWGPLRLKEGGHGGRPNEPMAFMIQEIMGRWAGPCGGRAGVLVSDIKPPILSK